MSRIHSILKQSILATALALVTLAATPAAFAQGQSQTQDVTAHAAGTIQVVGTDERDFQGFSQGEGVG